MTFSSAAKRNSVSSGPNSMHRIEVTGDGSHTLYHGKTGEHFHSSFGAITESQHIFIQNGINRIPNDEISVFEMGFGTGLNALLTLRWARENKRTIHYTAIDIDIADAETIRQLNYPERLNDTRADFDELHRAGWNQEYPINDFFFLHKIHRDIRDFRAMKPVHAVFYDAFSPTVQPDLWTEDIMTRFYTIMYDGGILVSYCVRGTFKQALRNAGFRVSVLPGPPGKRHMLLAERRE